MRSEFRGDVIEGVPIILSTNRVSAKKKNNYRNKTFNMSKYSVIEESEDVDEFED
jgi:hypothetical protein